MSSNRLLAHPSDAQAGICTETGVSWVELGHVQLRTDDLGLCSAEQYRSDTLCGSRSCQAGSQEQSLL